MKSRQAASSSSLRMKRRLSPFTTSRISRSYASGRWPWQPSRDRFAQPMQEACHIGMQVCSNSAQRLWPQQRKIVANSWPESLCVLSGSRCWKNCQMLLLLVHTEHMKPPQTSLLPAMLEGTLCR